MSENIIREVVTRTKGEMYLGVVGPVRSGKSTFIRKFMELKVLPFINDDELYKKVNDELPQSGEGKTIMTVEPKFIPSNQMTINVEENLSLSIRLVDCVGYVIPNAKGYLNEDGTNRLVQTPWFSDPIPFGDAAGIGTRKVIESHSNIGILLSSDGSFGEFSREEYENIEEKMVNELKDLDKPFVLVINTVKPSAPETIDLVTSLKTKYGISVVAIDVKNLTVSDIDGILKEALSEFDISELNIGVPSWVNSLDDEITFKHYFSNLLSETTGNYRKMKDVYSIVNSLTDSEYIGKVEIASIDAGSGVVDIDLTINDDIYNQVVNEILGTPIDDKGELIVILQQLKHAKKVYDKVGSLDKVYQVGYNLTIPTVSDLKLDEPELLRQGNRYGIKLKATGTALLLTKVEVESTFEPIIGDLEQATALVEHMKESYTSDSTKIWNSEIFGRKLGDVINDGIKLKVSQVSDVVLEKYSKGISKIINNGKGNVITIII